ncbi:hypothetical protein CDV55_108225 [Aspergillus turcosus]|nr:hypothetical protein CDV55_108225 [Aspergillus turcosus]
MSPKSGVLVPLYIYPLSPTTWAPLYDAITTHPDLDFLVVVNPNSGPGDRDLPSPNKDYAREVPRLNAFANVYTVGYVRIDYCCKPLNDVYEEIDRYASWSGSEGMGLGGILLDETPNHYSEERGEYLTACTEFIKRNEGILRDRMVIHNPGTPPDAELAATCPDLILTCEEPYERYISDEVQHRLAELPYDRTRSGYMINAVPGGELAGLVRELRDRAAYLFVTEVEGDFYERFGPTSWGGLMHALK